LANIEGRNNGNVFHEGEHVNVRGKSVGKTFKEYILHHKPLENVVISHFEKEDVDEYITIRGDYFLPIDLERINTFSGEIKKMFDEIIYSL